MRMKELRELFLKGKIEKKAYWTLMRENYTHVLPEIMDIINGHEECKSIWITGDDVVLEKHSGLKMYFDFRESMSRAEIDLCGASDPEKEDIALISEMIGKKKTNTVLDIGANVGMFSLELYLDHPEMNYHVFEPIPTTYSKLIKTIELNGTNSERFHAHNIGMSNEKGSFKFYLPGESEAASLKPVEDSFYRKKSDEFGNYTGCDDMLEVECQVMTVDEFIRDHALDSVGFIKIDVEGNEKYVLLGARNTLERFHPLVYCELLRKHAKRFGYHPNEVISYMKEFGYKCYTIFESKLIRIDSIDDQTEQTNFIFDVEKL